MWDFATKRFLSVGNNIILMKKIAFLMLNNLCPFRSLSVSLRTSSSEDECKSEDKSKQNLCADDEKLLGEDLTYRAESLSPGD